MHKFCSLLLLCFLCIPTLSQASDAEKGLPLIFYKIKRGDTLIKLSRKYLKQSTDLEFIRSLNHLRNINLLPEGEVLKIPRSAVKQSPSQATVIALNCAQSIRAGVPPKQIQIGSILREGAIIDIPAECHSAMQLEDGSTLRLPSSAAIKIAILRKNAIETTPEVQLDLIKGRVELDVFKGRAQTTPFEVRTPLSMTGVRGTEFRVGYETTEQTGQVEVLAGVVSAKGQNDDEAKPVSKGQGITFDNSGKALPVENLLDAPEFKKAERINANEEIYDLQFTPVQLANHYTITSGQHVNLLGERLQKAAQITQIKTPPLNKDAFFYQLASVSKAGLMGPLQQYGFCFTVNEVKSARCRATFNTPKTEGTTITFSLIRHAQSGTQELVSTKKLQSHNGQFTIEGLPSGRYTWTMSYTTMREGLSPTLTKQSGAFDLFTLTASTP